MRRLKRLTLSADFLVMLCRPGPALEVVRNALPSDATIAYRGFDARGDLVLTIESETFPPVGVLDGIPELPSPVFTAVR